MVPVIPNTFYVHSLVMGFVFSEYVEILQESMNLNSMAAQLILALPHIQEFTSSVRCINTIYTEVH